LFHAGADLLPDFFLDSDDVGVGDIDEFRKKSEVKQASTGGDELSSFFEKIKGLCSEDLVTSNQAIYQFNVTDHGEWYLDLKSGSGIIYSTVMYKYYDRKIMKILFHPSFSSCGTVPIRL
jgi:hypothetical protein